MNNCQQIRQLINNKMDNESNDFEQRLIEEHIVGCDDCRQYYEKMLKVHEDLTSLPTIDLQESIVDQLFENNHFTINEESEKRSFMKGWRSWYGIAAAVIVVLILPLAIFSNHGLDGMYTADEGSMVKEESLNMDTKGIEMADNSDIYGAQFIEDENIDGQEIMNVAGTSKNVSKYDVEIDDNRLNIYISNEVIFETKQWDDNQRVEWYQIGEDEIMYTLYDNEGNVMVTYQVDLVNLVEEIIEE